MKCLCRRVYFALLLSALLLGANISSTGFMHVAGSTRIKSLSNKQALTSEPLFVDECSRNFCSISQIADTLHFLANEATHKFTNSKVITIGKSAEKRPIQVLSVSNEINEDAKHVIIMGGMHGREWPTITSVLFVANEFVHNVDSKESNIVFHFLPLLNPDGYEYSRSFNSVEPVDDESKEEYKSLSANNGRLWRKTRRNLCSKAGRESKAKCAHGIDLNRNFGVEGVSWGFGSTRATTEVFQGKRPLSEPESKALEHFLSGKNVVAFIDVHCCSSAVMPPFFYNTDLKTKREMKSKEICEKMSSAMNAISNTNYYNCKERESSFTASNTGVCVDWLANELKIQNVFILETRGNPQSHRMEKIFEVEGKEIIPIGQEVFAAFSTLIKENLKEDQNLVVQNDEKDLYAIEESIDDAMANDYDSEKYDKSPLVQRDSTPEAVSIERFDDNGLLQEFEAINRDLVPGKGPQFHTHNNDENENLVQITETSPHKSLSLSLENDNNAISNELWSTSDFNEQMELQFVIPDYPERRASGDDLGSPNLISVQIDADAEPTFNDVETVFVKRNDGAASVVEPLPKRKIPKLEPEDLVWALNTLQISSHEETIDPLEIEPSHLEKKLAAINRVDELLNTILSYDIKRSDQDLDNAYFNADSILSNSDSSEEYYVGSFWPSLPFSDPVSEDPGVIPLTMETDKSSRIATDETSDPITSKNLRKRKKMRAKTMTSRILVASTISMFALVSLYVLRKLSVRNTRRKTKLVD